MSWRFWFRAIALVLAVLVLIGVSSGEFSLLAAAVALLAGSLLND